MIVAPTDYRGPERMVENPLESLPMKARFCSTSHSRQIMTARLPATLPARLPILGNL